MNRELLRFLDSFDVNEYVDQYFKKVDTENKGVINALDFREAFVLLNRSVGIKEEFMGDKEYEWMLNLIQKRPTDTLNREEGVELYRHMIQIARDYLASLQPADENAFKLIKKHEFVGDKNAGKSINTLIDLNEEFFIATTGAEGKVLIRKSDFEVSNYQKDLGCYVSCKTPEFLVDSIKSELFSVDFSINKITKLQVDSGHSDWISKIVYLGNNRLATASRDNTIKIWEIEGESLKLIESLEKHTACVISLLKMDGIDVLASFSYDQKAIFWDLKTFGIICEIDKVPCSFTNGVMELPRQKIVVSGEKMITVINFKMKRVAKRVKTPSKVVCFELINDYLLAGCFDGSYLEIDIFNFDVNVKEQKESNYITSMLKLPGNVLIVGLHNGILKVYRI